MVTFKKYKLLPHISLKENEAINTLIEDTINRIRYVDDEGQMDIRTANTIANLASKLIDFHKASPEQYHNTIALVEFINCDSNDIPQ